MSSQSLVLPQGQQGPGWWKTRRALRPPPEEEAKLYLPSGELEHAVALAWHLGEPLLLDGEAGCGKTQLAYWAALKFGTELVRYQVRSTSTASELRYHFDAIGYLRTAYEERGRTGGGDPPQRKDFVTPGPLWKAFQSDRPLVLLIDEVDKAPRDFPNDLLRDLDEACFDVPEWLDEQARPRRIYPPSRDLRPLVVVTSNSEQRLPDAFLRRCVYFHLSLEAGTLQEIVKRHFGEDVRFKPVIEVALKQFWAIRDSGLRKPPSTSEVLAWITLLSIWCSEGEAAQQEVLRKLTNPSSLAELPELAALIKTNEDMGRLRDCRGASL